MEVHTEEADEGGVSLAATQLSVSYCGVPG